MENPTNATPFNAHLKAWGLAVDARGFEFVALSDRHESHAIQRYLRRLMLDMQDAGTMPDSDFSNFWYRLFNCFQPAQAKDNPLNLAIYESKDKFDRDIRLSGKPGKIIKRILPFADESTCAKFAEWFKEQFAEIAYTIKESTEAAHFDLAYSGTQSKTMNPSLAYNSETKLYAKSLSGSCMRHHKSDFRSSLPVHPVEVYASGDFKIIWAEDSKGNIAARCVVNVKQRDVDVYRPGPIYVATDSAFNAVAAYLVAQGYDKQGTCEYSGWNGARIKAIPFDGGYIAPFMDLCGQGDLLDSGEFFRLSRNGEYSFKETSGVIEAESFCCHCEDCGDGIREDDDHFYIEDSGSTVCSSCYESSYFTCNGNGNVYSNDDSVEVYRRGSFGNRSNTYSREYVEDSYEFVYCENQDEYWRDSDTTYIESESIHVPSHIVTEDYFQSDVDSEWYSNDDKVHIDCLNQDWTLDQVEESDQFDIVRDNIFAITVTLKCHLEINESGSIVDNQMSLELAA